MPAKKSGNGTRKSSTAANESKLSKPMEPEIVVQDPPESLERVHATPEASSMERKNLPAITEPTPEGAHPLTDAEGYLISVLHDLEKLYDAAIETKAMEIKMDRTTFTNIATTISKAWESVQTAQHNRENAILKSLRHIQASITGLEQKYEDIQAKVTEDNTELIFNKLDEIQATTTRLENKYESIESTVKEAPKIYSDIIKATSMNMNEKAIAEMHTRQRQQRDALHQE